MFSVISIEVPVFCTVKVKSVTDKATFYVDQFSKTEITGIAYIYSSCLCTFTISLSMQFIFFMALGMWYKIVGHTINTFVLCLIFSTFSNFHSKYQESDWSQWPEACDSRWYSGICYHSQHTIKHIYLILNKGLLRQKTKQNFVTKMSWKNTWESWEACDFTLSL